MKKHKDIPPALRNIDLEAVLRKRGIFVKQKMNEELKRAAIPLAKKLRQNKQKAPLLKSNSNEAARRHAQFTNEQIMAYWEKQIHIVEILEARFEKKVHQFISKVVSGFLAHLDSEIAEKQLIKLTKKGYFDDVEDDLLVEAQLDFTPLLVDQAVLAGQEAFKLVGTDDIYTPYKLRDQVAKNVRKFTRSMLDTDRDTLVSIITDGLKEGKSVPEIRGMIQTSFDDISKNQAQRITRTEVLRVSNQASIDAYEQSGVVEGKQWLTAGAVDECEQYEGQIVSLSGKFYGDTDEFADGDPPLHPNCRCVVLPIIMESP